SFAVLTTGGDVIADSSDLPSAVPQTRADLNPRLSPAILRGCLASLASPTKSFRTFSGKHGGARCYARTFSAAGNSYNLVILASLHPESELLGNIRIALGWLIPFTIVLASIGVFFLARKSLVPVADMTTPGDHVGEITSHERFANPNPHDELGDLDATFNRLLSRLEATF